MKIIFKKNSSIWVHYSRTMYLANYLAKMARNKINCRIIWRIDLFFLNISRSLIRLRKNMERIPKYMESIIIEAWLKGYSRDAIVQEFGTSNGTVSNILTQFRNNLGHYDADTLRELGKQLQRQNMTADNCAVGFRIYKIMEKLKILEAKKMEEFLTSIFEFSQQMDIESEIFRESLLEFVKISHEMPFSDIPNYKQKTIEEIKQLENKKTS